MMKRPLVAAIAVFLAACSSSSSSSSSSSTGGTTPPAPSDGGTFATDASTTTAPTKGLTIANATDTTINGTYDVQVVRFAVPSGTGYAYNGNYQEKIEIEVDTDLSGAVLAAHVWSFDGASQPSPNHFYGCDSKTSCVGVTVDVATNVIKITPVVWGEVEQPTVYDGSKPDTRVSNGKQISVSADLTATASQ
jgi:hypothetical protein